MSRKKEQKIYAIFTAQEVADALEAKYRDRFAKAPSVYILRFVREPWSIQLAEEES